ncbi:unnamed protein product [Trifolium pratense]|nr:unnamed protein product [Trifolium pratense]
MCFTNEHIPQYRLIMEAKLMSQLFSSCFSTNSSGTLVDHFVKWNASNMTCIILNVDGSCLGTPCRAGFGGVLRNSNGAWISGFSGFIAGSTDILYAELLAIYHGLSLAKDLGHDHVACYSDSLNSLSLIQNSTPRFHIYAVLIQNIKDLLLDLGTVTLIHSLREGNSCADFMAKLGASSDVEVLVHSSPPPGLRDLLSADSRGVFFLRA